MTTTTAQAGTRKGLLTTSFERRLADLYDEHAPAALRLAYLLTRDENAAEDLCQEAFVRVGARLGRLRDPDRAAGYLFRTVVNLSRGHGRGLRRRWAVEARLRQAPAARREEQLGGAVTEALLALPQRQRAAVFFRYFEDLSERETAEVLGCTVGAVRSLTFRAMETLRNRLGEVDS